jgi:hypothetical protein
LLARPSFFKCWAHIKRRAFGGQNQREQALAAPPVDAGEVAQRCAFHQHDGVERVVAHQFAGMFLACFAFVSCDGSGFVLARLQLRERRRQGSIVALRRSNS